MKLTIYTFTLILKKSSSFTLLAILILLSVCGVQSQSLTIISYDSIVIGDAENSNAIYSHAAIQNTSSSNIDLHVKRIDSGYNDLTDDNAICWGICYPPETSQSNMVITIVAGGIDSLNFTGHVYPDKDGIPNSGSITYVFFNADKPTDSIAMTVQYQVDILSSVHTELSISKILVFPNPASDFINIDIHQPQTIQSEFKLYDQYGKLQLIESLFGKFVSKKIQVGHLEPGIYYYTITQNQRKPWSGKLFIQ